MLLAPLRDLSKRLFAPLLPDTPHLFGIHGVFPPLLWKIRVSLCIIPCEEGLQKNQSHPFTPFALTFNIFLNILITDT